jgi:ribosomal-protein-alanine N-acetyltransferase
LSNSIHQDFSKGEAEQTGQSAIQLRPYRASDLKRMHALDVVCFERPFRFTREAMRRFSEAKSARVIVAEERGALAGFVILDVQGSVEGGVGYVVTLDVAPSFRRRGVGRALMVEAEEQARRAGCRAMLLHVFAGNLAAMRFYESMGFLRSRRVEAFYGAGLDAWVCQKRSGF